MLCVYCRRTLKNPWHCRSWTQATGPFCLSMTLIPMWSTSVARYAILWASEMAAHLLPFPLYIVYIDCSIYMIKAIPSWVIRTLALNWPHFSILLGRNWWRWTRFSVSTIICWHIGDWSVCWLGLWFRRGQNQDLNYLVLHSLWPAQSCLACCQFISTNQTHVLAWFVFLWLSKYLFLVVVGVSFSSLV